MFHDLYCLAMLSWEMVYFHCFNRGFFQVHVVRYVPINCSATADCVEYPEELICHVHETSAYEATRFLFSVLVTVQKNLK